jgi:SAM-dependent methyltransferase
MHTETATCIACGSTARSLLAGVIDFQRTPNPLLPPTFDIWRCAVCGLGELAQKLDAKQLEYLYPPDYYAYAAPARTPLRRLSAWLERLRYKRYRHVPAFTSLLEIGCGSGEFLARIKDRGRVVGLERSAAARDVARRRGVDVRIGEVDDPGLFEDGEFDCVYLNHTLEHFTNPERVMRAVARLLRPGGTLYVGVPNFAGIAARVTHRSWYALVVPEHVTHWTPDAMRAFLRRVGFEVTSVGFHSDPISFPLSTFYALGGRRSAVQGAHPAKIVILSLSYMLLPATRLLDRFGAGDLMEVTATRL